MEKTPKLLIFSLALWGLLTRTGMYLQTPMTLDVYDLVQAVNETMGNSTCSHDTTHTISVFFLLLGQWVFLLVLTGIALLYIKIQQPYKIGQPEKDFTMGTFMTIGIPFGVYNLLITFARSGGRTPPYLHGILGSCVVPFQFLSRYFILKKKPTFLKLCCVITILVAEIVCLLPSLIPSLESSSAKRDDGGASGIGRILWPFCFVVSLVPFAVGNTLIEKVVQKEIGSKVNNPSENGSSRRINLVYYQFYWFLSVLISIVMLFWLDVIPGFGSTSGWSDFASKFSSNVMCLFGLGDYCPITVTLMCWGNFLLKFLAASSLPALIRYSEGATFMVISLTLRTPIVLLFWSLFDEEPFYWHPHAHLGTWLGAAAVCVMVPAVLIYDMGDEWLRSLKQNKDCNNSILDVNYEDEKEQLLSSNDLPPNKYNTM